MPHEDTDPDPPWHGVWQELASEVLVEPARSAIISHEALASLNEQQIARAIGAFAGREVHVVYIVRDLGGLLPSEWQEYVKHRCAQDYATWLSDIIDGDLEQEPGRWFWAVHDGPRVLERWAAAIPRERIHVITVPPPGSPAGLLWQRFAELVGIDSGCVELGATRANQALGIAETELLRRINLTLGADVPEWLYTVTIKDLLAHDLMSTRPEMRQIGLPVDRVQWVRQRTGENIAALRRAGYDIIGDLDELRREPLVEHAPPTVTDAEMLLVAADTMLGLLDHVVDLRAEVGRLHQERAEADGVPLHKSIVRQLSERNRGVMRMRVAYWHFVERMRGIEPGTGVAGRHEVRHRPPLRPPAHSGR